MQPAQHAVGGAGQVVLDERATDAVLGVAVELIGFEKKAALIAEQLGLDDQDVRNFGLNDIHFMSLQNLLTRCYLLIDNKLVHCTLYVMLSR